MLDVFKKLITDKGYFFEDELKNIPSTCCTTSTFKVLDFDKIKEEFCNKYGINSYCKSNDILILYQPKDELHFIEMKRCPTKKAIDFCNTYKIAKSVIDTNLSIQALNDSTTTFYNKQTKFNNWQKGLTIAIMLSTASYTLISYFMLRNQEKQSAQGTQVSQPTEKEIKLHILQDSVFLKSLKESLRKN